MYFSLSFRGQRCNLRVMNTLKNAFNCIVGYSDHTISINIPLAAVAMGANY